MHASHMSGSYHDGSRRLQDRFDTRRLADRLEARTVREVIRPDTLERMYRVSVQVLLLPGGGHTCLPAIRP